jgi:hypothetical protein
MRVQQRDVLQMPEQLFEIDVKPAVQLVECLIFSVGISDGLTCFIDLAISCSQHIFGLSETLGYFGILQGLRLR